MNTKKIGLFSATAIVAGNMMGSGIAMLPANLASIGSVSIFGWIITTIGALSLAYIFSKLAMDDPQQGGPVAYAGKVSPILGYQTGIFYFHANWIGNIGIALTGVSYLALFFPPLNDPITTGIVTIGFIWFFTFLNILGASWISKLVTIGVIALLVPVILTATVGWAFFDPNQFMENFNTSGGSNSHAIMATVLLTLWSYIGLESASVNTGLVKNPKRTVPISTMIGVIIAGLVYIGSTTAISGMMPAADVASSSSPFSLVMTHMFGSWTGPVVSAIISFTCLASLASWMMLVSQAGIRSASDGYLPKMFADTNKNGVPVKSLIYIAGFMSVLVGALLVLSGNEGIGGMFSAIANIAVLLTLPAYLYSALYLVERKRLEKKGSVILHLLIIFAVLFCITAFVGASQPQLAGTVICMLGVFYFFARKHQPVQTDTDA